MKMTKSNTGRQSADTSTKPTGPTVSKRFVSLDGRIDKSENTALRARWEFGRLMLELVPVGKKQLRPGVMAELEKQTGKKSSELRYRMKFAENYKTEEQVANVLATCKSWRDVIEGFSAGGGRNRPSKERAAVGRLTSAAESLLGAIVEGGLAREDIDAVRDGLTATKQTIEKGLINLSSRQQTKRRHPAGEGTETETTTEAAAASA
jgi:hypothetical protein